MRKGLLILAIFLCCGSADSWRIRVRATAYDPGSCCTDGDGITATGRSAWKTGVAVDPKVIPLGCHLDIPGYGNWQLADDVGGAIQGDEIDVRFKTHSEAKAWGVRWIDIRVWAP